MTDLRAPELPVGAPARRRALRLDTRAARIAAPVVFALLVLAVWQLYVAVSDISESSLPSPTEIAQAGWEQRELLLDNTLVTIEEILIGFAAAIVARGRARDPDPLLEDASSGRSTPGSSSRRWSRSPPSPRSS